VDLGANEGRDKNSSAKVPLFGIANLDLSIHCATFMGLRWWL